MDIQQIRYFLEVVKTNNFSEAAENLYTTQSSVSKNIKALEKQLNITLFDRTKRKAELTEAGQLFANESIKILDAYNHMMQTLNTYKNDQQETLYIGSIPVMAQYNITGLLADFQNSYPNIQLNISEYEGSQLLDKISNQQIDFAFIRKENLDSSIQYHQIFNDQLSVVLPNSHALASRKSISLNELKDEKFLLLNQGTLLYDRIINLCQHNGFNPQISYTGTRMENILDLIAKQRGISLMMQHAAEYIHNPNITIVPLKEICLSTIVLARCKSSKLSHAATQFWSYIEMHKNNKDAEQ